MDNRASKTSWKACAKIAAVWAGAVGALLFLVTSVGHWIFDSDTHPRFILLLLLVSAALIVCVLPPIAMMIRAIRLFHRAQRRASAGFLAGASLLLLSLSLILWRSVGAMLWDWLDVPMFWSSIT